MSQVFLDTSALIDRSFRDANARKRVDNLLPAGSARVSSRYVLFELARGFLRNLILLHNKAVQLTKFSDLMSYAALSRRHAHRLGTILGAFEDYFREGISRGVFAATQVPADEAMLLSFRGYLRGAIRRNWKRAVQSLSLVVNDVKCREDIIVPYIWDELYRQELRKEDCGSVKNCGLKRYVARGQADFVRLREELRKAASPDAETQRRIRALRELYRVEKRDFERDDCYSCGDAIIAHEAPDSAPILTKNENHFAVICKVFKKTGIYYK